QPLGDFSMSVWAQIPAIPSYFWALMTKHADSANGSGWILFVDPPSAGLPLQFQAAPLFDVNSPQANISTGTWFHAVFTYQRSSGSCKMYINGQLADSRVKSYYTNSDPHPFLIGAQSTSTPSSYNNYFKGLVDD